ncbi:MAG: hypothetical protein M3032_13620 [Verrucomicrobiota bacterium]|nr:hypothetical protein [Verrucomicrobiota bacterium]
MNFTKPTLLLFSATCAFSLLLAPNAHGAAGDLYQVSPFNGSIYKYSPGNGTPTIFASYLVQTASNLAFNKAGDLFVDEGEGTSARILKFSAAGVKTTFATGVDARGMVCDNAGNLFVSDALSKSIIKITPAGVRTTFASGLSVLGLRFDLSGNLIALDYGGGVTGQAKTYSIAPDGTITSSTGRDRQVCSAVDPLGRTFVGTSDGVIYAAYHTYYPESGFGVGTSGIYAGGLGYIEGMACDPAGNLFVSTPSGTLRFDRKTGAKTTFSSASDGAALAFEPPRALALNISTRLGVQSGENALIAGFIVTGPDHKQVLVRGMGPSLSKAGVQGALQNPNIEMHFPTGVVISNDNWKTGNAAPVIQGTAFAPSDDRESALAFDLPPGTYSVILTGVANTAGVGLVEVYDTNQNSNSALANISTRGFVGSGDNVMIGGFILGGGNGAARLAIRAIGPSLAAAGISNPLADPTLTLRDANGGVVNFNDNWGDTDATQIHDAKINPPNLAESAMIVTLPAGNYTAIVAGKNGGTGVGLVEVYNIQ